MTETLKVKKEDIAPIKLKKEQHNKMVNHNTRFPLKRINHYCKGMWRGMPVRVISLAFIDEYGFAAVKATIKDGPEIQVPLENLRGVK